MIHCQTHRKFHQKFHHFLNKTKIFAGIRRHTLIIKNLPPFIFFEDIKNFNWEREILWTWINNKQINSSSSWCWLKSSLRLCVWENKGHSYIMFVFCVNKHFVSVADKKIHWWRFYSGKISGMYWGVVDTKRFFSSTQFDPSININRIDDATSRWSCK